MLSPEVKRVLKQWLAARYGRPAFPNAFESRLRKRVGKRTVEQQIAKILELDAKHLVGLLFDFGEQRTVEVAEGEPYALSVSVVYDATEGGSYTVLTPATCAGRIVDDTRPSITVREHGSQYGTLPPLPSSDPDG